MGVAPTCHPANIAKLAYIEHEEEGVYRIRESLEHDMEAEKTIAIELRKSIQKVFELGDYATKSLLEAQLLQTEDRAHHAEHFLGEDSLSIGFLHDQKEAVDAE